ncbi:hypothetical protein LguiA_033586 [Lonicera macranthoides]
MVGSDIYMTVYNGQPGHHEMAYSRAIAIQRFVILFPYSPRIISLFSKHLLLQWPFSPFLSIYCHKEPLMQVPFLDTKGIVPEDDARMGPETEYSSIIEDIRALAIHFDISFSQVKRAANRMTDWLARSALRHGKMYSAPSVLHPKLESNIVLIGWNPTWCCLVA